MESSCNLPNHCCQKSVGTTSLGDTDERWAPPSIASLLTTTVIGNNHLGFQVRVEAPAAAGGAAHPAPYGGKMKSALIQIVGLATLDSAPRVLVVAHISRSFPDEGSLKLDLEEQNPSARRGEPFHAKGRGLLGKMPPASPEASRAAWWVLAERQREKDAG
ncbi:negative elongation factor A-like [Choloepus didactylus]|uniref:negative elongation factor A-like n=1 Tax=Choloepus didactylus TaxID=27675 RepID=UPI00189FDCAB|nr:negative elongation factor A-like [Choloepus didactylus]